MSPVDLQKTVKLLFQFANTSPEKFISHWTYIGTILLYCLAIRLWFAANKTLGTNWTTVLQSQLASKPLPIPTGSVEVAPPSGVLNNRKLGTPKAASNNVLQFLQISTSHQS